MRSSCWQAPTDAVPGDLAGVGRPEIGEAAVCFKAARCRCSLCASFEMGAYSAFGKSYRLRTSHATSSRSCLDTLKTSHHGGFSGNGTCSSQKFCVDAEISIFTSCTGGDQQESELTLNWRAARKMIPHATTSPLNLTQSVDRRLQR